MVHADDVNGTGSVTLQVHATGTVSNPHLAGSGSAANADLRIPSFQPNIKIDAAQIKFEADSAGIDNAAFHVGKSNWQGSIKLRNFANPRIAVSLKADRLSNVEMQSWFAPGNGAGKPIAVTGDIAIGTMQLNDLSLRDLKSGIVLRDKLLTLEPLSAAVYGG